MPASSEREYWDGIFRQNIPNEKTALDNVWKRRDQVRMLLAYDFHLKNVLEIGCGLGFLAHALATAVGNQIHYLGVDLSPTAVEFAKKRLHLPAVVMDARKLRLKSAIFDYVLAMDVLEHIPPADRPQVYAEIARVMKPEGTLIIHRSFMASFHDPDFDQPFDVDDIAAVTKAVGGALYRAEGYKCLANGHKQYYQMLTIIRGEP